MITVGGIVHTYAVLVVLIYSTHDYMSFIRRYNRVSKWYSWYHADWKFKPKLDGSFCNEHEVITNYMSWSVHWLILPGTVRTVVIAINLLFSSFPPALFEFRFGHDTVITFAPSSKNVIC